MKTIRNLAIFVGMFVLVVLAVSAVLIEIERSLINGRNFVQYFGWFSWGHATSPLLHAALFAVAGALQSMLLRTRNETLWAVALGLCYSSMRLYFASRWIGSERNAVEYIWAGIEFVAPPLGAWLGAWLVGRIGHRKLKSVEAA